MPCIALLKNKQDVYAFLNTVNIKRYVNSAKDHYLSLAKHISNIKFNKVLENAFNKHGLDKFNFKLLYCLQF